jgi:hypothetical protein
MGGIVDSVTDFAGDIVGGITGSDDAAKAAQAGAETSAEAQIRAAEIAAEQQQKALAYLKKQERLPTRIRDKSLRQLQQFYLTPQGQQKLIRQTQASPFYQQNIEAGEQAIGRNLAMTGGLRSGTAQEALAQNSQQVLQNMVAQRLSGIGSLAQLPSNAANIANLQAGIGSTLGQGIAGAGQATAQGQIAAGQAQQAGMQGLLQLGGQLGGAYMMSDPQLKTNIEQVGEKGGHQWYRWTWNEKANELGLFGESEGVMADEVMKTHPGHVATKDGYLMVNYEGLLNG